MISNARMAELYGIAHRQVEVGWTQHVLYQGSHVCLIGAIKYSTRLWEEEQALQADVADTLVQESLTAKFYSALAQQQLNYRPNINGHPLNTDNGIAFVEKWNDSKFRRKARVLKLLADRRDHYAALARQDRVQELTDENERLMHRLNELTAIIERLEIEVGMLKEEVSFWKVRALNRKRDEFARVLAEAGEINDQAERNTVEIWELHRPL